MISKVNQLSEISHKEFKRAFHDRKIQKSTLETCKTETMLFTLCRDNTPNKNAKNFQTLYNINIPFTLVLSFQRAFLDL